VGEEDPKMLGADASSGKRSNLETYGLMGRQLMASKLILYMF